MLVSLVGWTLFALVMWCALARPVHVLSGLVEWQGPRGRLTIGSPKSLAVTGSISVLALAFWGAGLATGGAGGPASAPAAGTPDPPNAPTILSVTQITDTATLEVQLDAFSGSLDDTHDSTRIRIYNATDSSLLVDSLSAPTTTDTVTYAFEQDSVYNIYAFYKGTDGGWSDSSTVWQHTHTLEPYDITTFTITAATDSSLTLQWVLVNDGAGGRAYHARRYKNVTSDSASFSWGGTQESASEVFDSLGTNIGDTVSVEVTGLTSGDKYTFGIKAYRCDTGGCPPGAIYGSTATATGSTVATPPVDTTETPSITSRTVVDSSTVSFTGSGFQGGTQTHDSTKWEISRYSGSFSALIDSTSAAALTSITVAANAVFKADTTYAARVTYYGSSDASAVSDTVAFTMTQPGGGDHPNEPTGTSLVAENEFDNSALTTATFPTLTANNPNSHPNGFPLTQETDAAAPGSGTNVLSKNFANGDTGGTDAARISSVNFSEGTLYLDFYFEPSSDFSGHSSGVNKIVFFGTASGNAAEMFVNAKCSGSASCYLEVRVQSPSPMGTGIFQYNGQYHSGSLVNANEVSPTAGQATIARGSWNRIELLATANSVGTSDGTLQFWLNGVQIGKYTTVGWEWLSQAAFSKIKLYPIYGGTGGTVPTDMEFVYDAFYASGK